MPTPSSAAQGPEPLPLFVDLDAALLRSGLLAETLAAGVGSGALPAAAWAARRGPAAVLRRLTEIATPDPASLPYREPVLAFLREERRRGRVLILTSRADRRTACSIADFLGIFDEVLAGDGAGPLEGTARLDAVAALCRERGWPRFAYLGGPATEPVIWRAADERLLAAGRSPARTAGRVGTTVMVFPEDGSRLSALAAALRPQHWLKNGLLFLPLLLAHEVRDQERLLAALLAFASFSLAASAVYVINDALDVQADRHHPDKRRRPFASGSLPLGAAPPLAGVLLVAAFALSAAILPAAFTLVLVAYLVTTSLYSAALKRVPILDVITLAGLYALRVFAGGTATDVPVSQWLMVFSIFLFTSLAFCKRYSELLRVAGSDGAAPKGRGYEVVDIGLVETVGPTSGLLAVLVLALYLSSEQVQVLYRRVDLLWALIPLLLFWVIRLWFLARRGVRLEDPVVFAATDRTSLGVVAAAGLLLLLAS